MKNKIRSGIFGLAIGDALGVPVEFQMRASLKSNPVTNMRGFGTYHQPPGTWSDDTSMTLCLVDALAEGTLNNKNIMDKFCEWMTKGKYTPYQELFDIGNATRQALLRYMQGYDPMECGGKSESENGNGSLMRILPMAYYLRAIYGKRCNIIDWIEEVHSISKLTHAHARSQIACGIYICIALYLIKEYDIKAAIDHGINEAFNFYLQDTKYSFELTYYKRIQDDAFGSLDEAQIKSSGYVVDSLEAALWCLLNTNNYKDCVLKAVNLGEDTDTVAAIAGGLAGIAYGIDSFPEEWISTIAQKDYIEELCSSLDRACTLMK